MSPILGLMSIVVISKVVTSEVIISIVVEPFSKLPSMISFLYYIKM